MGGSYWSLKTGGLAMPGSHSRGPSGKSIVDFSSWLKRRAEVL